MNTVDVPARFFEDHESRDLPVPTVVKRLSKTVRIVVEPESEGWRDLFSDAVHYDDYEFMSDPWTRGLALSARATKVKMLQAIA